MPTPFDYVNSIFNKTEYLMKTDYDMKEYNSFVVNRALSFNQDCVYYANSMNIYHQLDTDQQYTFYYHGISKGKRFGKWLKSDTELENLQLICDYYGINKIQGKKYLDLLSDENIEIIKTKMDRGGKIGK